MSIKLVGSCEKKRKYGVTRRVIAHVARLGNVEAESATEKDAFDALTVKIARLCGEITSPTIMYDLIEVGTVWIAYPTEDGWAYDIVRPGHADIGGLLSPISRACRIGGAWSRNDCMDHMREHWYMNNIAPIVNGIVGLCTDQREFVCPKCKCVGRTSAPYRCVNPACGHLIAEVQP